MTEMPVAAVFFDFAGTLFSDRDLRDVHLGQLRLVAAAIGVSVSDAELRAAYRAGMGVAYRAIAVRPSYLHRELFGAAFAGMAETLGGRLTVAQADELVDRQYAATVEHARLRPECLPTLTALRASGRHVQIVSNIDDEQLEGLISGLGLADVLSAWTSSEEALSCKPDRRIYEVALAKSGCDAGAVLFVGDTVAHDIEGPAAAGMRTALLIDGPREAPACSADHVIRSLDEVLQAVGQEAVSWLM